MRNRCRRSQRELLLHLDSSLSEQASFRFEAHLENCTVCRQQLRSHRRLEEEFLSLPRPALNAQDRERLLEGIHRRLPDPAPIVPLRRRLLNAKVAAVAAALVVAFFIGRAPWRPAPPLDAFPGPSTDPIQTAVRGAPPAAPLGVAVDLPLPELPSEEERRETRDLLSGLLASLPEDGPFEAPFLAGARPLLERGLPVAALLQRLVIEAEGKVARNAARVIGRGITSGALGPPDPRLVPTLARALEQRDRNREVLGVLLALDSPAARRELVRATEIPGLRRTAALHLFACPDPELRRVTERLLLKLLRSGNPDDHLLLWDASAVLHCEGAGGLRLLASAHREGAAEQWLATVLDRSGPALRSELAACLLAEPQSRPALTRRQALGLVRASPHPFFADPLAELVRRGVDVSGAVDALADLDPRDSLPRFAELVQAPTVTARDRRILQSGFGTALRRAPEQLGRILPGLDPALQDSLMSLCAATPGGLGTDALLGALGNPQLDATLRGRAGLLLAAREAPPSSAALLAVLSDERARLGPERPWPLPVVSSVLVSLYQVEGVRGLEDGCAALGLELAPSRSRQLRRCAHSAASRLHGGDPGQCLADMAEVLALGP